VKPAPFDYHRPADLAEALTLLGDLGDDVKVLAGGQSLVPMMNFRLARPAALVDLNRIDELAGIRRDNGTLSIGAMTRQWDVERDAGVRALCPVLPEALRFVGHTAVRMRGTIGGSLAHADPAAELPVTALALGADMVVASAQSGQRRVVPADAFFVHYFTTALADDELLVETRWPVGRPGRGAAFCEFALRHGDFALAAVAAAVTVDDGLCREARIAVAGVAPTPVRVGVAEAAITGTTAEPAAIAAAGAAAAEGVDPVDDVTAPAGYRRHLVRHLTEQALTRALAQARRPTEPGGRGVSPRQWRREPPKEA
jgi:aerobic carbon-monoxide dehydrogenase medium subunit